MHRRSSHRSTVFIAGAAAITLLIGLVVGVDPGIGSAAVGVPTVAKTTDSDDAKDVKLDVPAGTAPGDLLVASIAYGARKRNQAISIDVPAGWNQVAQVNENALDGIAVFTRVADSGTKNAVWKVSPGAAVVAFMAKFSGVDPTVPVELWQTVSAGKNASVTIPGLTTSSPGGALITVYSAYREKGGLKTWSASTTSTEIGDNQSGNRRLSSSMNVQTLTSAGPTGSLTAVGAIQPDSSFGIALALRPATTSPTPPTTTTPPTTPPTGPTTLIVDTDIFSDADDVTALAEALALQALGETRVIAVGVNTRTSRPAVSTDSWRCAAAVLQWYGSGSVPLGTSLPNNGTDVNTPDFVKPCAALASPATPNPDNVVNVYRRALAAQPDKSVSIASTGYLTNLSDLLNSAPDAISPLSGRDLIARKVRTLVAMGGGYPSWPGENNLRGAWVAAQNVAINWTSPVVWAGYETGDLVHTGQTISSTHPANSPVRVAYEAFVRPGNWIYSYDLLAVYHAVRPNDSLLTLSAKGSNAVDANGGNVFTTSTQGTQQYLVLPNATALSASIETLLGFVPASGTATTGGTTPDGGTATGGGPNQRVIFDDALVNADDWGWAPHTFASTSPVQSGTKAIAVTADPWTGLQLHLQQPFTATPGSQLEFWINGEQGGQQLSVDFFGNGARKALVPIGTLAANQWRKVQIDTSTFGPIDVIIVYNHTPNAGGRYSLDAMRLTW